MLMTKAKTSSLTGSAAGEKLRRASPSARMVGSAILLAVVLFLCVMLASCVKPHSGGPGTLRLPDPEGGDDYIFQEHEMENVRFEPVGLRNSIVLQPSLSYWLKRGDSITAKWDTLEFHYEREGKICTFPTNTPVGSDGNCLVCDYCLPQFQTPPGTVGRPCLGNQSSFPRLTEGYLNIVVDAGFIQTENPTGAFSFDFAHLQGACPNTTQPPPTFAPETSGLYRLSSLPPGVAITAKGETNGEIKIHVLESGMTQKVAYKLTRQTVDGVDYWTWPMRVVPPWLENFSPDVRVTSIRIQKGDCVPDSVTGICVVPDESAGVKPSRILFLPNFGGSVSAYLGQAAHVCYAEQNSANSAPYINLTTCRERSNSVMTVEKFVTPTYETDPANPLERITWLVEFNTGEGADSDLTTPAFDPMPTDAVLVIEFTIKAF